jgi:flagella basal body P-ring formation protein FlgA
MKRSSSLFLFAVLIFLASSFRTAFTLDLSLDTDGVVLNLLDKAEANADSLRLRDILASETVSSYGDIPLGLAPSLGRESVIRRSDLDARLHQILPHGVWSWVGAEQCVISRPSAEVTEAEIIDLVEESLRDFTKKEGSVRVLRIFGFSSLSIPKNGALTQVELVSPNGTSRFGGAMVNIDYQGKSILRRNLRFEWEWKKPVWVSQNSLSAGKISSASFSVETRDVLSVPGEPLSVDTMPDDLALVHSLAKGEILLRHNIKTMLAVTSGSDVVANIHSGTLLVSMKAVALENGVIGQNIKIQNPTSRKELVGRIVEDHTVEITP